MQSPLSKSSHLVFANWYLHDFFLIYVLRWYGGPYSTKRPQFFTTIADLLID